MCGLSGGVPLVHRVHGVDVRRGLVDEPLPAAVDQDAAGQAALGQAEERAAGQRYDGPHQASSMRSSAAAGGLARQDPLAGVPGRADRPLGADGARW